MSRSKETFGKKDVRSKQLKKRKEKEQRRLEKKEQGKKSNFDDMIAWVDENGRICDTPPDPKNKTEVDASSIELGATKSGETQNYKFTIGKICNFDDSKGFGFISSSRLTNNVFFHQNDCDFDIRVGDKVEFETEKGPKGLKATNIKKYNG